MFLSNKDAKTDWPISAENDILIHWTDLLLHKLLPSNKQFHKALTQDIESSWITLSVFVEERSGNVFIEKTSIEM
jgi:hypothetical protein